MTVKLKGGMGNQMFQYAMGLAQARRLGTDLRMAVNWYYENGQFYRGYSLGLWEGVTQPAVRGVWPNVWERSLPYDKFMMEKIKDGDCIAGSWQTERYFREIRGELTNIFCPKQRMNQRAFDFIRMIRNEGSKSALLSIRRTDYLHADNGLMPQEYYLEACKRVVEREPDPHFFVFSDDPGWCKQNFRIPYRFTVMEGNDQTSLDHLGREDEDMWSMRFCHHAVTINSSFSWWGAWLSPLPVEERVVVAPKRWSLNPAFDFRDIVPEGWTKI